MATNDDLDDFFKKKDRKGHKNKKQSGLLTNNQELLKQLEIVTSATSAFKENLYLDEDDEELQKNDEPVLVASLTEEIRKNPIKSNKNKIPDNTKTLHEQEIINSEDGQQDEWEDFESSAIKYEQLRLKFAAGNNDNDDEYDDDENNHNDNDHNNDTASDRNQQKDKPAWSIDQKNQEKETNVPVIAEKIVEDRPAPVKPTAAGAYRPPALRGNSSSVTVVSGNPQRVAKKKEPNLASTDEFPTLGSAVHKK
ncbi:unnamed protein product [Rotaria socialis]|uniref:Protein CDV3 homolog n=1 Tax=Rotaria socialis TaxID=392032 RepID=A0A820JRS3_9BILA|nr:unnamed protein product [Rotaria socialis]CAF3324542.1 unnamed protein product [Rotaria socialis]CAF3327379.1 unnamed protein product [Rotaria socialis]CAF3384688.1 unnamed protein product [Rotaria socialis]CAF3431901.1 unnamed protein product [Rotaria socialis]